MRLGTIEIILIFLRKESLDNAVVKVFSADLAAAYKCIFLPPEIAE